ncbi:MULTISPECIES: AI-2E family transporter [Leuconostoc]|uniref:AI-2E family transporter n=1 Tax=Leuconostoc pseudomesenteroides TaxID=33968 RepID=A0A5B8T5R8_LEUPS|nr:MULTISPECIES: AI-2E family transporter [Leuconostoc]MCC7669903.1 AI-2E family transporter [Leuconostoc pseudomesenteroides]MCC8439576.1 AI-2E family transporter [Leuconostoc pseudomesenteroides]MDN2452005.1 AI-2E family transporter [Leuconostoc sp. UCMA20149]NKZ35939.1 AI-2E family transporter [Leuconostoc pseudomesenteroides]QEA42478.1 AI-2E family transporter [Leuconostoc pseudomesenteroides]
MDLLTSLKKRPLYRYFVLFVIILLIACLKQFMTLLLLTIIFAYLAMNAGKRVSHFLKLSRSLSIALVYVIFIGVIVFAIDRGANTVIHQFDSMVKLATNLNWHSNSFLETIYKNFHQYIASVNTSQLISQGLTQLNQVGHVLYELILALLFSFIFSMTYPQLRLWSMNFLHSPYKKFFGEFYIIVHRFIIILGKLFEVQLMICLINTAIMMVVLAFLQFPYLLGFTVMIFILGLIPVFGVIISLIPLTITAFIIGDWNTVIIILVAIAFIHFFESYFLHPHFMSHRTHMPILVILLNLIIMEKMFGVWGLVIGLPILTFLLDFFRIQKFNN